MLNIIEFELSDNLFLKWEEEFNVWYIENMDLEEDDDCIFVVEDEGEEIYFKEDTLVFDYFFTVKEFMYYKGVVDDFKNK